MNIMTFGWIALGWSASSVLLGILAGKFIKRGQG